MKVTKADSKFCWETGDLGCCKVDVMMDLHPFSPPKTRVQLCVSVIIKLKRLS